MTLKDILNAVLTQSTFLPRAAFFTSTDPDDVQMTSISNRVAYEIFNFYNWGKLRTTYTVTQLDGINRYKMPDDFQMMVPDSGWETDGSRKVDIPVPDGRWYMYKFSTLSSAGTIRARFYGDYIELREPEAGEEFSFEYISKWPIAASNGTRKEFFTADDDVFVLDDQLLVLGVQAHWQQAKRMPNFVEYMQNYKQKMNEAIARSAGGQTIGGPTIYGTMRRPPYYPLWRV
jgi:hypothetical protein